MKISIWASFLYPHVGGYEKNILELSKRLVARGHRVDIITCKTNKSPDIETIDGVNVIRIPCVKLLKGTYPMPLPSVKLLGMLYNKRQYDVVVTQTRFFVLSLVGAIYSVAHRIPLIHVERGSRHTSVANPVVNCVSKLYDHTLGRWIMSKATQVVGVSGASCDFAKHLGACNAERIPNGVIVPELSVVPRDFHGTPMILYVGRLIQAKGVQDLIRALGISKWKDYSLAIVGDGPYRKELERLASGKDNIKFCSELVGEKLNAMYRFARVFVNPSYSEGLPTAVMEAASLGIPIVATDVGGTSEIVENGVTGTLVRPGNVEELTQALSRTLGNPMIAFGMAAKCQERVVKEYDWDMITDKYCELLQLATKY
jgi:glycosyltransferase involved in cell wall biosynthesis